MIAVASILEDFCRLNWLASHVPGPNHTSAGLRCKWVYQAALLWTRQGNSNSLPQSQCRRRRQCSSDSQGKYQGSCSHCQLLEQDRPASANVASKT
jgi:hypothetical protein